MDPNRFVQKGGDPADLSIKAHHNYGAPWVVLCAGRQVFSGDLYACVHWRAQAERLFAKNRGV